MEDWIQKATKEMDKKGTIGAFTKQAKRAKMSTDAFADEVLSNPSKFHEKTRKRAQFYKNMQKKYAKGGEVVEARQKDLPLLVKRRKEFKTKTLEGKNLKNKKAYVVLAYGEIPMWIYENGKWYRNAETYNMYINKTKIDLKPTDDFEDLTEQEVITRHIYYAKGGELDSLEDRIKENYADAYVEHKIEVDRVGENEYIIYADKLLEQNDEDGRYNGYNSKGESLLYEINEDYFGSSGKMLDWGDRVYLRGVVLSKKKMAKGGGVKISNYTATKETEDFYEMDSYVKGFYNENDLFLESKEVDGIYPINVDGKRLMHKGEGYVIKKGKKYMFMQPIYEEMAKGGEVKSNWFCGELSFLNW